jgi:hypothetical protein
MSFIPIIILILTFVCIKKITLLLEIIAKKLRWLFLLFDIILSNCLKNNLLILLLLLNILILVI